ncbi:uncharacterized protein LOC124270750 isoform X2 [Haliotis rubra]|uniref:uncharacterized protein LOC124270750 isoform X2 n=1 Tax=Haliotis rubra TaxID=36100 RepID=UPI001EE62E41|nr:uncharacterized protein LOC124270750 isoform X2 [Haliotis rubra]
MEMIHQKAKQREITPVTVINQKQKTSLSDSDIDNVNQSADYKAVGETALASDNTNSVFDSVNTLSSQTKVGRNEVPNMTQEQRQDNRLTHMLPNYAEYDAPFRNVENIDFELEDLVGYSDETSRPDIRNVLTLFEMCIRSVSAKHFRQKQQLISSVPLPIKDVLYERRRDQAFTSIQLSSLHDLLAFMERDSIMLTTLKNYGVNETTITTYRDLIVRTRNIWNDDAFESIYRDYIDGECTSILPFSYVNQVKCPAGNWGEVMKCFPICQLSVVASVIELMLPQHISLGLLSNVYRNCSSESELIRKATDTMVYSVRKNLKKRYPAIVEVFFNCALPYVFWARGNIKLAAECFLRIAQTEDENSRAVFLCEAARLYAQNEEPMKAKQLYMEASDSIMWRSRLQWEEKSVRLQKFMLMASAYDQGVMTPEKATQAAGAWEGAMNFLYPSCPQRSSIQPVESFLCFHSGTAQERVQNRLEYCVKLIERLVDSFEFLLLHLSLVMALLGDEKKSLRAFSTLIFREKLEMPLPWLDNQHNPWQPVLDHVAEHGTPKCLKVIWRTQLGHPRIVNSMNSFEGDYQSMADLNLRLTDAGFITADLQMMMPPIRALKLDPYTGLHLHTSGLTTKWHSFNNSPLPHAPVHRHGLHIVPTLTEVYRDTDTMVHLSCPDYSLLDIKSTTYAQQLTLFWTGPGDQGVKLDLIPFLKAVCKQRAQEVIEAMKTSNRFRNSSPCEKGGAIWEEKMKMALEYCFAEGYKMSQHTVEEVKNRLWEKILKFTHQSDKRRKLSKKEIQEDNPTDRPTYKYEPDSFSFVVEECFAYRDTVYLAVYDTYTPKRIQVFVDCSSKESFMQPYLTTEHSHDFCDRIDDPQASSILSLKMTSKHRSHPPDDIMWHMGILKEYRNHRKQYVYGKKGKLLKTISDNQMVAPHVLGSKLYGLTTDKLRVRCDPITEDEILSEEFAEIRSLLFGGDKVIAVTESMIYFLHPDTLQTLSVTQHRDSNVKVSEDGHNIRFPSGSPVKILEKKKLEEKTRLAFGIGEMLMFVDVTDDVVEVVIDLLVPGVATEVYTIREDVDFLVSVTVQKGGEDNFYREHVFHYNHHGKILGVLPFLGPGPRCFCVEYLKELDGVTDTDCGRRGWHVFMRDGHEGIIGVRL